MKDNIDMSIFQVKIKTMLSLLNKMLHGTLQLLFCYYIHIYVNDIVLLLIFVQFY